MAAIGLAIIGRNNLPLYVREFLSEDSSDGDYNCEDDEAAVLFGLEVKAAATSSSSSPLPTTGTLLASGKCWFALHAALDRLEQLTMEPDTGKKKRIPQSNFVGLLLPFGETRVYGYLTNTQTKFLLMVEDCGPAYAETTASGVKRLFGEIHELYVKEVMNPFHPIIDNTMDRQELSEKFDRRIQKHISNFNQQEI
mmetsp:Transcript_16953/g.37033  ORF Transcript_16953/g.37033 Transcript_16953/m.37033 type:complete len:196 (+) Transcript_16953:112-699(+)